MLPKFAATAYDFINWRCCAESRSPDEAAAGELSWVLVPFFMSGFRDRFLFDGVRERCEGTMVSLPGVLFGAVDFVVLAICLTRTNSETPIAFGITKRRLSYKNFGRFATQLSVFNDRSDEYRKST